MTLDEMLALLPDNDTGAIDAADLRTIVTGLFNRDAALQAEIDAIEVVAGSVLVQGTWQFSASAPPPTGAQVRLNNTAQPAATQAVFRLTDNEGFDRSVLFAQHITKVRLQDADNAAVFQTYAVTGPAVVVPGDSATLPITWVTGGGVLPAQRVRAVFEVSAA